MRAAVWTTCATLAASTTVHTRTAHARGGGGRVAVARPRLTPPGAHRGLSVRASAAESTHTLSEQVAGPFRSSPHTQAPRANR